MLSEQEVLHGDGNLSNSITGMTASHIVYYLN